MLILGIETSCDETAAAVVQDGVTLLSSAVASSEEFHRKYGGIFPEVAAREQVKWILPVIDEAIKKTKTIKDAQEIDALAVTVGPGLIGSLLIGVETAKALALVLKKPIIPINHLIAHFYAAWLDTPKQPQFPLIGLLASGGHTDLILMKNHGQYDWLGGTRDDAGGECFDKTARLLGLGYPGGPAIQAAAETVNPKPSATTQRLPRPMLDQDNFDFSFSGLKTAVLQATKKVSSPEKTAQELAHEIQEAITDVLVKKTIRAAEKYRVKTIVVGGGVAANKRLKEKFQSTLSHQLADTALFVPPPKLCTDNAATIASCAFFNFSPIPWQKIQADAGLSL